MPYVHCPTCRLPSYSAAKYSGRDACPHCGSVLTQAAGARNSTSNEGAPTTVFASARTGSQDREQAASPLAR
jgi:hypothetical protein